MKLIGLDYGKKRIGVAVTDETGDFIRGLPTIDRATCGVGDCISVLGGIISRENPEKIVIGLPLDPCDAETAFSLEIRKFAGKLSRISSVPVEFVDESLTSRRAYDIIRMRKKKHRRAKENIDRIAACLILEAFQREKRCG
jgi:putative Holliday junction resolvase